MKARISNLTFGRNGESYLTLATSEDVTALYDDLHECDVKVDVKKWYEARTGRANSYAWALLNELAKKNNEPVMKVYRRQVRDAGVSVYTTCIQDKEVERYIYDWESKGEGWQIIPLESKLDGCTNLRCYRGSSSYDREEMSRFIESIEQDCVACDIPIRAQSDIEVFLDEWEKEYKKRWERYNDRQL